VPKLVTVEAEEESSRSRQQPERASADLLLGLLFDLEDGDSMFLRNVRLPPNCTASQLRGSYVYIS
jgi:hypothetical protein